MCCVRICYAGIEHYSNRVLLVATTHVGRVQHHVLTKL